MPKGISQSSQERSRSTSASSDDRADYRDLRDPRNTGRDVRSSVRRVLLAACSPSETSSNRQDVAGWAGLIAGRRYLCENHNKVTMIGSSRAGDSSPGSEDPVPPRQPFAMTDVKPAGVPAFDSRRLTVILGMLPNLGSMGGIRS